MPGFGLSPFLTEDERCARQSLVAGRLDLNAPVDVEILTRLYSMWVQDDMGIILKKTNLYRDSQGLDGAVTYEWMKARKRGNDVDTTRTESRLRHVAENVREFAVNEHPGRKQPYTRSIYVTLTYDPSRFGGDVNLAWENIGRDWNLFLSKLRVEFKGYEVGVKDGEIVGRDVPDVVTVLRSWEAHESGWPHIHAILCFRDTKFKVFRDGNFVDRIDEKDAVAGCWEHGFIDVQAVLENTVDRRISDVVNYVVKGKDAPDYRDVEQWPRKGLLTQAILWYRGARAYSVSRSLAVRVRLDSVLRITQKTFSEHDIDLLASTWEFVGLCRTIHTDLDSDDWYLSLKAPPDWLDYAWKPYDKERKSGCLGGGW